MSSDGDEEWEGEEETESSSDESIFDSRKTHKNRRPVPRDLLELSDPLPPKNTVVDRNEDMPSHQISTEKDNPNSADVIQDYGMYSDIPDNLLVDVDTTPSVPLLRSSAPTPNLSIQENPTFRNKNGASSSTPPTLTTRHEPSQPEDQQPSLQGATSSWTSDGTLKIIDFTKTQELLVPAPSNPFEAFWLLLDDNYLDMIVHVTNLNAMRVFGQPGVTEKSRITHWKDLDREE